MRRTRRGAPRRGSPSPSRDEESRARATTLSGGLRWESQDTSAVDRPDRDFDALSASVGLNVDLGTFSFGSSVARSVKLPNAEELYSDGPHLATGAWEIGDPNLDEEVGLGLDLVARLETEPFHGTLSLFWNRLNDYIYESFTDEEIEELPVFRFEQADAELTGGEVDLHWMLFEAEPRHLELEITTDWVRGELRDSGEPLPRISPRRHGLALRYDSDHVFGFVGGRYVAKQDRVAEFETETASYTMADAGVGVRFLIGPTLATIELRGSNLTDEVGRVHTSYLKDRIVLAGRRFAVSASIVF